MFPQIISGAISDASDIVCYDCHSTVPPQAVSDSSGSCIAVHVFFS
jgi:hypothetical protein